MLDLDALFDIYSLSRLAAKLEYDFKIVFIVVIFITFFLVNYKFMLLNWTGRSSGL